MSNPPALIGVTTYGRSEDGKFSLPGDYIDAVRRAGGIPVLLPPGEAQRDALFDRLDGLVLAGGGDIAPAEYGSAGHATIYMVDPERDASELYLAKRAVDAQLPTLAICRGLQIVNVAYGGTLHENVSDQYGESVVHRAPPRHATPHRVRVNANSRLAAVTRDTEFTCQSWHHQAVKNLAADFEPAAHADDGLIEAIESPRFPHLLCVQWHPELTAAEDPIQQRLFKQLVVDAQQRGGVGV
ncbi:MAG: gamma-glutamyl-gamma-aminobutyrate hydrolase family protein [Gammaproteobacteria bacterium]|nr:gamma-glutamyl-gamma-aminobutyrate hydrolase family protein [Gammaproteobacteria bacterium]MDH3468459.1 gamma-glutamyl-gamma-aminobutyrate hydrolase family protein [Gammaproteobacteria bacterium]